jgi:hypothetical protein
MSLFSKRVDHPHTAVVGAFEETIETRMVILGVKRSSPFAVLVVLAVDSQTINQIFGNEIILKNTLSFVSNRFTKWTDFAVFKRDFQAIVAEKMAIIALNWITSNIITSFAHNIKIIRS